MLKKLLLAFFSAIFYLFSATQVLAADEFLTDYQVKYDVYSSGVTHTKFDISLTNNLSNIYAKEFSLSIGSTKLENIAAYNEKETLEPQINQGDKTTNIIIPFNDKVLGKDKGQNFTLEFDSLDFASKLGNVWEISIPKLSKSDNLRSYSLVLSIPQAFGIPATISPHPISSQTSGSQTIYRFSSDDILNTGISAVFGQIQYFDFDLTYHLENPNVYRITTEIALPPDTAFQKITFNTLEPQPYNVELDLDGNWLASYSLSPKQNITISAKGSAEIHLKPREDFPSVELQDFSPYLKSQQYWETDNPNIQKISQELKTPYSIYQYVVNNLIYDYGRLSEATTRFGAANALDNQDSAICMEFTDLFVALSRAANIPSRAINGFAYTTNSALRPLSLKKDVLHAWPEYFDEQTHLWIPVDPTWGNTTGGVDFFHQTDLNHFTFSIMGQESDYPVPAGAYKTQNQETKDVLVEFGKPLEANPQTQLIINLSDNSLAGVNLEGQLILKNTGNIAVYHQTVTLNSEHFNLPQNQWQITVLPPFSQRTINFTLPATAFNSNFTDKLSAASDLSSASRQITILPAYHYLLNNRYFIIGLCGLSALLISFVSYRLIVKRRQKS